MLGGAGRGVGFISRSSYVDGCGASGGGEDQEGALSLPLPQPATYGMGQVKRPI